MNSTEHALRKEFPAARAFYAEYVVIALAVLVNLSGLFTPVQEPDAALYAGIAKKMVLSGNYLDLFSLGADWLDKPHFPFWVTALSFKMFGINTFAYKIPGILFLFMAARYTYLLAKDLYDQKIAFWSVIILLCSQHIILSNSDVRAEPYLTGLIIASVYYFYKDLRSASFWDLLLACVFAAGAVMTKGIFSVITIGAAIFPDLLIRKEWKKAFSARWLLAALLVLVLIIPELYSLYHQFDLHPEKLVFGKTGVSGLHFFFWDSQFGRFMNTGPIKGHGDPFFFLHTLLWAFLPWPVLLYTAIFFKIRLNVPRIKPGEEFICISGALVTLLLFSASKFQLPHYSNIVFPFLAITSASFLFKTSNIKILNFIKISQNVVIGLLFLALTGILILFRPGIIALAFSLPFLLQIAIPLVRQKKVFALTPPEPALFSAALSILLVNLALNILVFPEMLSYQAGSEAADYINVYYKDVPFEQLDTYSYALNFYSHSDELFIHPADLPVAKSGKQILVYALPQTEDQLKKLSVSVQKLRDFDYYHTTKLSMKFLNAATRSESLEKRSLYLVKF